MGERWEEFYWHNKDATAEGLEAMRKQRAEAIAKALEPVPPRTDRLALWWLVTPDPGFGGPTDVQAPTARDAATRWAERIALTEDSVPPIVEVVGLTGPGGTKVGETCRFVLGAEVVWTAKMLEVPRG